MTERRTDYVIMGKRGAGMTDYTELVKALRCKSLSKQCDSCKYGYRLCPDSECNDACHVEQIYADAADAVEQEAASEVAAEEVHRPLAVARQRTLVGNLLERARDGRAESLDLGVGRLAGDLGQALGQLVDPVLLAEHALRH